MEASILVIRGGAIGDFILTLPVLAALRRRFPETHLEVLGYPRVAELALAGGLADAIQPIEARELAAFFAPGGPVPLRQARYFAKFAVIVSYLYDPDRVFQGNVAACSKAQFITAPHRPSDSGSLHATELFLRPLERLAIFGADPTPRLVLSANASTSGSRIVASRRVRGEAGRRWLAAHPGSGSEEKNWGERAWSELLRRLVGEGNWNLLLVGGEVEEGRLERLARLWPSDRVEIAQSLPLVELAGYLSHCSCFIGHDSGITHLAAALGLSGLVLWGESKEVVWRPRSDRMRVIRAGGGLEFLSVDSVLPSLRQFLAATEHPQPS